MQIKRIIFIRSGETDWNKLERWQGWVAVPLNDHGRYQVQALANFLRNIGVGALYSSDLKRGVDTAEIIAARLGIVPTYDPRLRERKIGTWQGMSNHELQHWYAEQYQAWLDDRENYQIPEGESLSQVYTRMRAAFDDIVKEDKAETVGIVSHTVASRRLLAGITPAFNYNERLSNSSVTTVAWDNDHWKLVVPNDIAHLEGIMSGFSKELGDNE